MFARANAPCVNHVAHEDAAIAHLARVCHLQDHLYRRLHEVVAAHDGQRYALYHVRRILHTAVYPFLSALSDAMHVVVLKPVDVRLQQCLLHILELCLSDNCFNPFHIVLLITLS